MSYNSKTFLNNINKFEYKTVFLTTYFVGIVILYFASKIHDKPWIMLVLSVGIMALYGIYAYSFREDQNLSQIADSAYYLGFLFYLMIMTHF